MGHGFKALALAAGLATFGPYSTGGAATVVVTGVDLLTRPGVSFPSITPSVSGTSLFFGSTATFSKLISINLDPSPDTSYALVLNFTRVPASDPSYDFDHDLHMVLSDGTNMVGAMYGDNTNGTIGGVTFLDGQSSQADGRVFTSTVTETGFPSIGQTFDYALDFSLATGSTTVTGRLNDAATTVVETSRALNPAATHSLVLVSDEPYTQYQLNSVTFVTKAPVAVGIDIKPGSATVCNGGIPVAVLGSDTLDVTQIDPATLIYEGLSVRPRGNGGPSCSFLDANGDGYVDLVCQYQDAVTDGTLTGQLLDGTNIKGSDSVCVLH